ncbi:bifunctional nuclease family protein [Dermacoccaceae bacterium W4C1]
MREVEVLGVRVEMPTNQPIVLLREQTSRRHVPIWIGAPEASAIAYAQQGVQPPRPLTHDLLASVISDLGHSLVEVRITKLEELIFHAELILDGGTRTIEARASDAIALALRAEVPILVDEAVIEEVGVVVDEDEDTPGANGTGSAGEPGSTEKQVEQFREFLDHVSAEDFETDGGSAPGTGN